MHACAGVVVSTDACSYVRDLCVYRVGPIGSIYVGHKMIGNCFVSAKKTCICRVSSHIHNMNKSKEQCSTCQPSEDDIFIVFTFYFSCINNANLLVNCQFR